jgi:hypothetical protein
VIEFEIESLCPTEYREREVRTLQLRRSDAHRFAFQSFNVSGAIVVVDGGRRSCSVI